MRTLPPLDRTPELIERFWKFVTPTEGDDACWEWQGRLSTAKNQYGIIKFKVGDKFQRYGAHRVAFLVQHGHWPAHDVCHTCDNPKCVRGSHLWDGTKKQNNHDMRRKDRSTKHVPTSPYCWPPTRRVFTWEIVQKLRADYAKQPESYAAIATRFGVLERTIKHIIEGKTWKIDPAEYFGRILDAENGAPSAPTPDNATQDDSDNDPETRP